MISEAPTRQIVKQLRKAGWSPVRTQGSHTTWKCPANTHSVSIPDGLSTPAPTEAQHEKQEAVPIMERNYEVNVTRDGKWWMVSVPELDELTQARRLAEVEQMARELISVTLDVAFSTVHVHVTLGKVGTVDHPNEDAQAIRDQREEARRLEREAAEQAAHLAQQLAAARVPMRDIGTVLGVSYQRAHQLACGL